MQFDYASVITFICSIIKAVQSSLIHTSFPAGYLDLDLLLSLMRCHHLRSIGYSTRGLRFLAPVWKGSESGLLEAFDALTEDFVSYIPNPHFASLTSLDFMIPHAGMATTLIASCSLASLVNLTLRIPDIQCTLPAEYGLTALLPQLNRSSPLLRHLTLFMIPEGGPWNGSFGNIRPLNSGDLYPIRSYSHLETFRVAHTFPIDISILDLDHILHGTPHLRVLILNPHPIVMRRTPFGIEWLSKIASRHPALEELGLFFHTSEPFSPPPSNVHFHALKTLYVGTSTLRDSHSEAMDVCFFLERVLPKTSRIALCPKDFRDVVPIRTVMESSRGTLKDAKSRPWAAANVLWTNVQFSVEVIREAKKRWLV